MNKNGTKKKAVISVKRSYGKPTLKSLGSVRGLTLKLGSLSDSGQAGQFA